MVVNKPPDEGLAKAIPAPHPEERPKGASRPHPEERPKGAARRMRLPAGAPDLWIGAAVLILAAGLPFIATGYLVFQLTLVIIYAVALLGLNLLAGFNGQVSLGQGAFYAI